MRLKAALRDGVNEEEVKAILWDLCAKIFKAHPRYYKNRACSPFVALRSVTVGDVPKEALPELQRAIEKYVVNVVTPKQHTHLWIPTSKDVFVCADENCGETCEGEKLPLEAVVAYWRYLKRKKPNKYPQKELKELEELLRKRGSRRISKAIRQKKEFMAAAKWQIKDAKDDPTEDSKRTIETNQRLLQKLAREKKELEKIEPLHSLIFKAKP